jgi:hypothetical protein
MATWQFDFHVVPKSALERRFGDLPVAISEADYDKENWWAASEGIDALEADLDTLLPRGRAWDSARTMWGTEDGHRLELLREGDGVYDFFGRLDMRELSLAFLNNFLHVARRHSLVIITKSRHVLRPSVSEVTRVLRRSPSYAFVTDPKTFLRHLESD